MSTITRAEGLAAIAAWWAERDTGTIAEKFYYDDAVVLTGREGTLPQRVTAGHLRAACAPTTAAEADENHALTKANAELQQRLDSTCTQRNTAVIAFADLAIKLGWKAGWGRDDTDGYDEEWRTVVYVDMPNGKQLSWHMSPDVVSWAKQVLPPFDGQWDRTFWGRTAPEWLTLLPAFSLDRVSDKLPPADPFSDDLVRTAAAVTITGTEYLKTLEPLIDAQIVKRNEVMAHVRKENAAGRDVVLMQNGKPVMTMYADPAKQREEMRKPLHQIIDFQAADEIKSRIDECEAGIEMQAKANRFDVLRKLCGYVENGSDTTVKILQDDATRDWLMRVGVKIYTASSFEGVIDAAAADLNEDD